MASPTNIKEDKIAVIGSGLVGRSFAMLFACAGYKVSLYDEVQEQVERARAEIHSKLKTVRDQALTRGTLTVDEQIARVSGEPDLQSCVRDAFFIQECVPENLELKKSVWKKIDSLDTKDDVILSSSSSAIVPSKISEELSHRSRFVVSHPTNPPFYCPLLEIIPAPWTDPDVVVKTKALMLEVGQDPIILNKEINGFVLNRIQYAIFGECYRLVEDGVISVQDCDKVMSSGLGTRYAFIGPFETAYLNAEGFKNYCDRYRDMIYTLQKDMGSPRLMDGDTVRRIHDDIGSVFGSLDIHQRRQWRDDRLVALAKLKQDADKLI